MNKTEQAQYLINLHSIMEAQSANGQAKSVTIAAEYEKNFDAFKSTLRKEQEDETRKRDLSHKQHEDRAEKPRDQSGGSQSTGKHGGADDKGRTASPR